MVLYGIPSIYGLTRVSDATPFAIFIDSTRESSHVKKRCCDELKLESGPFYEISKRFIDKNM